MDPVSKALWFIESHFANEISLDDIARVSCVSRFHLARAFGIATGMPVIGYLRARRLSEAAKTLARGAPDILAVALSVGYGSHEAFTRAFRDQFGLTPEAVRAQSDLTNLELVEAKRLPDANSTQKLEAPSWEEVGPLLIAGLGERLNDCNSAGIPALWQRFGPHIGHVPGQNGSAAFGVLCNGDDAGNRDYVCGVEVVDFSKIPADFSRVRLPRQKYAVFLHRGHVSAIRETWNAIWNHWAPRAAVKIADAPEFERYTEVFNPITGMGGVEIWIPIES